MIHNISCSLCGENFGNEVIAVFNSDANLMSRLIKIDAPPTQEDVQNSMGLVA